MEKEKNEKFLISSQQGELDAVPLYVNLAKKFEKKNPEVAQILRSMAADEGRHASVFKKLSGVVLKPKKLLATAVPILMNVIGKKNTFKLIAISEYSAFDNYAPWIDVYPEIASVQADERKHGDLASKIITLLK
ncbi:MAG: rubrerythrin [Clostridia bacterium]|nr:rubrerythrin [Clostridia bacterium]